MIKIEPFAGIKIDKLELLGEGTQGKVYRINLEKCIKVFKSPQVCSEEFKTLFMAQQDIHFPRLYGAGDDFIIRECINGIELNKYLEQYPLTIALSEKIIDLYDAMMNVSFKRLDSAVFHIFVTCDGSLKLIDTAKALKKKTKCPRLILNGLKQLDCKEVFLDYVKEKRPDLFRMWINLS